ncbi:MAG TPA: IS66 family transposase [Candidatus Obscuribacterales bacterium]
MVLTVREDNLPDIPAEYLNKIEHAVQQVERIASEMTQQSREWAIQRLQQQAVRLGKLQYYVAAQQHQIEQQQTTIQQLEHQLEHAQRASKRQAAPFRVREKHRKSHPKPPGRKPAHAGAWRKPPVAKASDEHIEVSLEHCPDCGEALKVSKQQVLEQTIVEIPEVQPRVIRLRTYSNACEHCQRRVRSEHPLQVSMAVGAAGTHLGPRAIGLASDLNKRLGLPMRKTCEVLQQMAGLSLSAGGLSQAMARAAERLRPRYDELLDTLRQSESLHCDETGWWVATAGSWLWVLTNEQGTYYRIVPSRNRDTARALIGEHFQGVLVSDCLAIYDDLNPHQHKCYAHHLKAISQALQTPSGSQSPYLLEVRTLLHSAMLLKRLMPQLKTEFIAQIRQRLEERADALFAHPRSDPQDHAQAQQEEKIRQRLSKQRDHLFTFLDSPAVEATNNRAERQLRPAVISRKVSCGNKTQAGARTWEILASLAATAQQRGESFVNLVADAMTFNSSSQQNLR